MNCNLQIMVTLIKESWNLECGKFLRLTITDGHGGSNFTVSHSIERYLEEDVIILRL